MSTGVILAKVMLAKASRKHPLTTVGYLAVTELKATDVSVRNAQLDQVQAWVRQFRLKTFRKKKEIVAFSVISADLSFDNVSECDQGSWNHAIFDQ